jgi:hypothetical protein
MAAGTSGCFQLTSKGPTFGVGPGLVRHDWNEPRRDPDPTLPLVAPVVEPWAGEAAAPRRKQHRDLRAWLMRAGASLLASLAAGELPLPIEFSMDW